MKKISVNIDNATTLTLEEEHRYLKPSDIVKISIPCKRKEKKEE